MTRFWVHVLTTRGTAASFTVALSRSPHDSATFGTPLPTRTFNSWESLSTALSAAGIPQADLDKAQQNLKRESFYTFADIALTDEQRAALGFGTQSGSATA